MNDGVRFEGLVPDFHADADRQVGGDEEDMEQGEDMEVEVCKYCDVKDGYALRRPGGSLSSPFCSCGLCWQGRKSANLV